MKKLHIVLFVFSLAAISCKSKKEITKIQDSTEVSIPFSGKQFENNKDFFRAKQVGESTDLATAKKIAEQNAKAELASNIEAVIKRVTEQYTNQRSVGSNKDFENKFEEMSREIVRQDVKDVNIIGEKLFRQKDGLYSYWIAIESSKETTLTGVYDGISKDAQLKLDFDKYQFEKIFNDEMSKYEAEHSIN
ncbi:hypothetical protein QWY87_06005 [Lutimonas halocynthiae]|uniref:hypothetical protein n=1 Tax=Lutimonas halocynthiae TaxID=1446477 RepID=UPI0025B36324|nr:hypothetical protein [Lutimonas halocynthiae]MDN3642244.1 hypothetical protein [Lutimonas halocynthiae]